jgi:hypothetical protein
MFCGAVAHFSVCVTQRREDRTASCVLSVAVCGQYQQRHQHKKVQDGTTRCRVLVPSLYFCKQTNTFTNSTTNKNNLTMTTNTNIRWTRRVRSVLASVADVTGDWFYYQFLIDHDTDIPNLNNDILDTIFLIVVVSSTFFGFLSILVMGIGGGRCCILSCWKNNPAQSPPQERGSLTYQNLPNTKLCGLSAATWVALLEIVLEDIPQLVITTLVSCQLRGPLSSQAVFNLTTSSINFVLDVLDIGDDILDEQIIDNTMLNNNEGDNLQV